MIPIICIGFVSVQKALLVDLFSGGRGEGVGGKNGLGLKIKAA